MVSGALSEDIYQLLELVLAVLTCQFGLHLKSSLLRFHYHFGWLATVRESKAQAMHHLTATVTCPHCVTSIFVLYKLL